MVQGVLMVMWLGLMERETLGTCYKTWWHDLCVEFISILGKL
jgi:hypothetical protein